MPRSLVVPTIFDAVDNVSPAVRAMQTRMQRFETSLQRSERIFNRLTPSIGAAAKQMLSFAGTSAVVLGIGASVKALMDYETAVQSFRTILSEATDKQFSKYQDKINEVARDTKRSAVDVALGFEKIAGLNAKFADTAEGIGNVSKASLILARASGMELGPAAENLVGIMNQFSLGTEHAARAINVLAAGQGVGASTISQTAEAFVNFGAVANSANVTIEESVALVQTLGKYSLFGADAGTALRSSLIRLQKAGLGYKSGIFNINDALNEAKARMDQLSSAKAKDAYLTKVFGLQQITAGKILTGNIGLFNEFKTAVTGTNEAYLQAEINSKTLAVTLDNLKNAWINLITSSSKTSAGMDYVGRALRYVTNNLETIVTISTVVIGGILALKAAFFVARTALLLYNIQLGITGALSGTVSIAIGRNVAALTTYRIVTGLATAAQATLNAVMAMNPFIAVAAAAAALGAGLYFLMKKNNELTGSMKAQAEVAERTRENSIDQIAESKQLFRVLETTAVRTREYTQALADLEAMQPGITKAYNLDLLILRDLSAAEKDLTKNIMARAEAQARAELYKEKIKEAIQIEGGQRSFADKFTSIWMGSQFGEARSLGRAADLRTEAQAILPQKTPVISSKDDIAEVIKTFTETLSKVELSISAPASVPFSAKSDSSGVKIKTTKTMGFFGM